MDAELTAGTRLMSNARLERGGVQNRSNSTASADVFTKRPASACTRIWDCRFKPASASAIRIPYSARPLDHRASGRSPWPAGPVERLFLASAMQRAQIT